MTGPRSRIGLIMIVVATATAACAAEPTTDPTGAGSTEQSASPPSAVPAPQLGEYPELPEAALDDAQAARMQDAIDTVVEAGMSDAIAASVIVPGVGRWAGSAGEGATGSPLLAETQFAVASITKTVVAAQVLALAEDDLIELDEPIDMYLPAGLDAAANGATVREMLAMESGLAQITPDASRLILDDLRREWVATDVVALLDEPVGEPGEAFSYNNVNYVLLGAAVEEITGKALAEVLRAHVLADPRLERFVYQGSEPLVGPVAPPGPSSDGFPDGSEALDAGGGLLPFTAMVTAAGAAGAMASDAATLATWGYLLYGGSILEPESLTAMVDADDGYGLGAARIVDSGLDGVGHGGSIPGYQSVLYADAETGTIIAVLVTGEDWPPPATTAELLQAVQSSP